MWCNYTTDMWYTMAFKGDVPPDYISTVARTMTPERTLLNEVLTLLKKKVCDTSCVSITKTWDVTTDLKRNKLEQKFMMDPPPVPMAFLRHSNRYMSSPSTKKLSTMPMLDFWESLE